MKNLNQLLNEPNSLTLKSWNDRYRRGVWVVVGGIAVVDRIQELADGSDEEAMGVNDYLCYTDWLLYEIKDNFTSALQALDKKLHWLFVEGDEKQREERYRLWRTMVSEVEANLFQVTILPSVYNENSELIPPKTFDEAKEKGIFSLTDDSKGKLRR